MPATESIDIYVRVSRVGRRDPNKLRSADDQIADARRFLQSRQLPEGVVLPHDIDESGGKADRPGLQEALRRVRASESGGVVVSYLSRLVRDTPLGLHLLDEIDGAGGTVYAPNLPDDYRTADGRMLTTIQLAIDEGYRRRKAEEFERAKIGAVNSGIHLGNRPPTGLRWRSAVDHRLLPTDDAAAVREAFEARAAGAGPTEIGRLLETRGVRTSQGSKTWSKQAVAALLRSRVYLGELRFRDHVNANAHAPIVDAATWEAAQHLNGRARPLPARGGRHALTGVLRCRSCGYAMQGTTTSRGSGSIGAPGATPAVSARSRP
ncbi:MAG TPA: recombinase family protein [Solirubrobacteraceae bacterium]|nr:recombinase family protein [Solirubrobacteraceae bacterium]